MILPIKGHSIKGRRNSIAAIGCIVHVISILLLSIAACAQVENNTIAARSILQIDALPSHSTTDKSTVEWACVNKKITGKCLIYHNDQWFTFTPAQSQILFLNISQQQCQKKFGVQVMVIEGNPCETETYKLLHCESFTDQSDVFIRLDSLMAGKEYLVNIDGFLGDICGFEIQIATMPNGLPLKEFSKDTAQLIASLNKNIVRLAWTIKETTLESIDKFEVYRKTDLIKKNEKIKDVIIRYNTVGQGLQHYSITDTLPASGVYNYKIVGVFAGGKERIVLNKQRVEFKANQPKRMIAQVPLAFSEKGDVDFLVMDATNDIVLFKQTCMKCKDQLVDVDLTQTIRMGITKFKIKTYHIKTKESKIHMFYFNSAGEILTNN